LIERVGLPVALDMLCAGKILTGEEAYKLGLVSRVVAPEALDTEVNLMVRGILKGAPQAIAATKRLARAARDMSCEAGLGAEASAFASCFGGSESKDGMAAFLEKRSASFAR
jgi:enoyl-CoA hydratase